LAAAEAFFSRAAEIYEETYFLHPLHHSEEFTRTYLQSLRQVYTGLGHVYYLQGNDSLAEVRTYMTARILLNIYTYSTYMTL
jgi:hypothetical protein